MDIDNLKAFLAVAETGSFSRAAEHLYLTQPAISKRIAGLEGNLDIRLFDRIGRKVTLTEAGKTLLPRARRLLVQIKDIRRAIADLSDRVAGTLYMATSHHIGLHRLPPVLRAYALRYPEVALNLKFLGSEDACKAVERGELELALVTLPPAAPAALLSRKVWNDPLYFVTGRDHPLAQSMNTTLTELARYPAILPEPGTYTRALVEDAFAALGLPLKTHMSTNYLETIKMMVSIGLGWSALPRTMLDEGLRTIDVEGPALVRDLGVVHHAERTLSNAGAALLEVLRKAGDRG